jgi:hypothetical protein
MLPSGIWLVENKRGAGVANIKEALPDTAEAPTS